MESGNFLPPDYDIIGHQLMDLKDDSWNEKSVTVSANNNEWLDPFGNITEVELYKKWNSNKRPRRRRLVKSNVARRKAKKPLIKRPVVCTVTTTITAGDRLDEDAIEGRRVITFTTESCQASLVSMDSLRGRLAHKTNSCVEDVISVLQDFSISASTNASSNFDGDRSWKDFSRASFLDLETERQVPESANAVPPAPFVSQEQVFLDHDLALPGHLAIHSAMPAFSTPRKLFTSWWRRAKEPALLTEIGLADWTLILDQMSDTDGIKIHRVDSFGHSILHIAAGAGARPSLLLDMINKGADIHVRNSGSETFLHLVQNLSSVDRLELSLLLLKLQQEGFDFSQRDDHGQTPLHLLSRQWVDESALEGIAENLLSCGVEIPVSRDNLGRTVLRQIIDVGLKVPIIGELQELVVAQTHNIYSTKEKLRKYHKSQKHFLPNYASTPIETMEDLQLYGFHADLLRTIRTATSSPRYEDEHGRNGLHCLAEVSLSLHIPCPLPSGQAKNHTRREAYLSDLIEVNVDPDNCDKAGVTPLMAFILHTRDDEDDETTIRILSRLHSAGVNLNRRDRNGQTALHLSVSLGKTAITRFLVDNGANVHARDNEGKGVIAVGKASSDKASSDVKLYAQIMMCIACVAGAGGISAPTYSQEWTQR